MKMEKISLSNIKDIIPFLNKKQSNSCDYTLGVKYMWRDYYQTEYAIINQTLVMGEYYNKGPYAFYYPIGEDVEQALKEIEIYSINRSTPLVFGGLSLE